MILYNASSSYYSMIARLALLEAAIPFENRRMDIHLAKEQLDPWYCALNPKMTVPTLVDGPQIWTDSQDILNYAAQRANTLWLDSDAEVQPYIQQIVYAHYNIIIERLTFIKALSSIPLLRFVLPNMLRRVIKKLESKQQLVSNELAVKEKIALNQQRIAFFTEGNIKEKLELERTSVRHLLAKLPNPSELLFGNKISSADIVIAALFTRLKMIGEERLLESQALNAWFARMQQRAGYKNADMWTYFQPWRIVLKR